MQAKLDVPDSDAKKNSLTFILNRLIFITFAETYSL
jgi:hypothetical protein